MQRSLACVCSGAFFTHRKSSTLVQTIEDLNEVEETPRKTISEYKSGELSHLESPQEDQRLSEKISESAEALFQRIPLPSDPYSAALTKTSSEVRQTKRNEVLVEAMRLRYHKMKQQEGLESMRIHRNTEKYTQSTESASGRKVG